MNKQTIKIFTILAVLDIVFNIAGFVTNQFTEWYTLFLVLNLLAQLCFLTLVYFIGRDVQHNYLKQPWQVYLFIGYSVLLSVFTVIFHGTIQYLSVLGMLYLILAINVAVFFINSVYQLFGIVFLSAFFLRLFGPLLLDKVLPNQPGLAGYLDLLPLVYPIVLLYIVRTELNKIYEQADSIGSIEAER
jgi:hypothetical protein